MRLRRAVLQIPAKSSVPPRLPFHKNHSLPTPSQSTLPQMLIPLHFNSFSSNAYKKTRGRIPAAIPKVCQLVTRHALRLRTHSNARNPNPLIRLLHSFRHTRGWGSRVSHLIAAYRSNALLSRSFLFSAYSVISALKSPFQPASTSAGTRKPSPKPPLFHYSLLTTHYSLVPLHFKVRFTRSLPGAAHV